MGRVLSACCGPGLLQMMGMMGFGFGMACFARRVESGWTI